jgi:Uma2 family endonuclease
MSEAGSNLSPSHPLSRLKGMSSMTAHSSPPKFQTYEAAGVAEVWMVDTASNTVLVYSRSSPASKTFDVADEFGADEVLTSALLPHFVIDVAELFAR